MAPQALQVLLDQPDPMGNLEPQVIQAQMANQAPMEIQATMANPEVPEFQARMANPVPEVLQVRKDIKVLMAHPEEMGLMARLVLLDKRRMSLVSMVLTLPQVPLPPSLWAAKTLVSLEHQSPVVRLVHLVISLASLLPQRQALVRAYRWSGLQLALVVMVLTVPLPFHMCTWSAASMSTKVIAILLGATLPVRATLLPSIRIRTMDRMVPFD